MSVQAIEQARKEADEAQQRLKDTIAQAVAAGVPKAKAARAAGVATTTVFRWLAEGEHRD
ncbi:hypothetical protein [Cutibacterium sp.]|uniref:hypothetical protein n=1 Tax=Cutibacterium sp. TaxID=1912221 RepID=UPI0026DAC181|nr:hypothetical protein [Cutibacterium sp.]MDO4413071.1 hypothetical protein [Cutibacterium sp.]